jgi:hypothetical protein
MSKTRLIAGTLLTAFIAVILGYTSVAAGEGDGDPCGTVWDYVHPDLGYVKHSANTTAPSGYQQDVGFGNVEHAHQSYIGGSTVNHTVSGTYQHAPCE